MYFWQVSLLTVGSAAWVRWASFLDLNFLTAGGKSSCPFPASPETTFVVILLSPLFVFVLLGITALIHQRVYKEAQTRVPAWPWRIVSEYRLSSYWRTTLSLFSYTFNIVTRQCLDFFNCTTLPSGSFMVSLPGVRCDSAAYRGVMPLVVILLMLYLLIPVSIVVKLFIAHTRGTLDHKAMMEWWGGLYQAFRKNRFWWSQAQTMVRLGLVTIVVFLYDNNSARLGLLSIINLGTVVLLLLLRPNQEPLDNMFELLAYVALAVLSNSTAMNANDAWLAFLTIGVGLTITGRLVYARIPSRVKNKADTASPNADNVQLQPRGA